MIGARAAPPHRPEPAAAYREALQALLRRYTAEMSPSPSIQRDPKLLRNLQDELDEFSRGTNVPPDVQFLVFFLDTSISSTFSDFFGDIRSNPDTDGAKHKVISSLRDLLHALSNAKKLSTNWGDGTCLSLFVNSYFTLINDLNSKWRNRDDHDAE